MPGRDFSMFRTGSNHWMKSVLRGAAVYSLASGFLICLDPALPLRLLGVDAAPASKWWSFIGAIAAVYGVGYLIAARDPYRHWPVVLIGLLSKTVPPLLFVKAASASQLHWSAGWATLINDVIWWVPFALTLRGAFQAHVGRRRLVAPEVRRMALRTHTQLGPTVAELSRISPILLVFLRHSGCPFCREALSDLSRQRGAIDGTGTRIVLIHTGPEEHAEGFFSRYQLDDLPRVSDPKRSLYRAFGLGRGSFLELLGPQVWWRGFYAGIIKGHGAGRVVGDGFQMPGVALVYQEQVIRSYRHQTAADRPDYLRLAGDDQLPELAPGG